MTSEQEGVRWQGFLVDCVQFHQVKNIRKSIRSEFSGQKYIAVYFCSAHKSHLQQQDQL